MDETYIFYRLFNCAMIGELDFPSRWEGLRVALRWSAAEPRVKTQDNLAAP